MRIEKNFNKARAELVEVQAPIIQTGGALSLGIKATFLRAMPDPQSDAIAMHMTPNEAFKFGHSLIAASLNVPDQAAPAVVELVEAIADIAEWAAASRQEYAESKEWTQTKDHACMTIRVPVAILNRIREAGEVAAKLKADL